MPDDDGDRMSTGRLFATARAATLTAHPRPRQMSQPIRVRRGVHALTTSDPWPDTLLWYARAVAELRSRSEADPDDPTGWTYMAAIHGNQSDDGTSRRGDPFNQCQHTTWYFLPWHRVYLHYFEGVVRDAIASMGGSAEWALPYWDYSDPGRAGARALPQAFRDRQWPGDGDNPLFTEKRDAAVNGGGELPAPVVDIVRALSSRRYENSRGGTKAEFGGPRTPWVHFGRGFTVGLVENVPHNYVHGAVGGPGGWMSDPRTAALDPIFWLHHANVDRLWEVWRGLGEGRQDTADAAWRNESFRVGGGPLGVDLSPAAIVDTGAPPLGYRYDDVSVPDAVRAQLPPPPDSPFTMAAPDVDRPAEMVGATEAPIPLASRPTSASVPTERAAGPAAFGAAPRSGPDEVILQVENVTGSDPVATAYAVYVNLPEGADPREHEDREAGRLALFGLPQASNPDGAHAGSGLTFAFDITDVARRLAEAGDWDPDGVRVTFVPDDERAPDADVTVGRVSVHHV